MSDKNDDFNQVPENIKDKQENNEENGLQKPEENKKDSLEDIQELDGLKYSILKEDYPVYDLSFKIIIIGDSGKYLL
jgi:hypothetical protein